MNKKGVMFTLIAILLSTIILSSLFFFQETRIDKELEPASLRIQTVNNYIRLSSTFYENLMSSHAYNLIENIINAMIEEGEYLDDFDFEVQRCFVEGEFSVNGVDFDCEVNFNEVLQEWDEYILQELNFNSQTSLQNIRLTQENPWEITVEFELSLEVEDSFATWHANKSLRSFFRIEGLYDPTYEITHPDVSEFSYNNTIKFADLELEMLWQEKPSTLEQVVINQEYFFVNQTPSFLGRLQGNFSPSDYGIVSIVKPSQTNINTNISHIDYLYWRQECQNGLFGQYDFWSEDMNEAERFSMEINDSNPGLQDTIIPQTIASLTNMSDTKYYQMYTIDCP
ncbi:MAG: hypothetical protein ACMXX6_00225 [Candidatus Woesearchaeota archaeon]